MSGRGWGGDGGLWRRMALVPFSPETREALTRSADERAARLAILPDVVFLPHDPARIDGAQVTRALRRLAVEGKRGNGDLHLRVEPSDFLPARGDEPGDLPGQDRVERDVEARPGAGLKPQNDAAGDVGRGHGAGVVHAVVRFVRRWRLLRFQLPRPARDMRFGERSVKGQVARLLRRMARMP